MKKSVVALLVAVMFFGSTGPLRAQSVLGLAARGGTAPSGTDTNPTIVVISPTTTGSTGVSSTPITMGFVTADDFGVTLVTCVNDRGGSCVVSGGFNNGQAVAALSSGVNVITFTVTDTASHTGQYVYTVTFTSPDSTPPTVTAPADYATVASTTSVSASCTDDLACVSGTYTVDGGAQQACSGTSTISCNNIPLATIAAHTIVIRGFDQGGNEGQDTVIVTRTDPGPCSISIAIYHQTVGGSQGPVTITSNDLDIAGTVTAACGIDEVRCGTDSFTDTWSYAKESTRSFNGTGQTTQQTFAANNRRPHFGTNSYKCWAIDEQSNTQASNAIQVTYNKSTANLTTVVPRADQGVAYTIDLIPDGGNTTYNWDNQAGGSTFNGGAGACAGLSIADAAVGGVDVGRISGTPTATGTCNAPVRVCDTQGTPSCDSDTIAIEVVASLPGPNDHWDVMNARAEKVATATYRLNDTAHLAAGGVTTLTGGLGHSFSVNSNYTLATWVQTPDKASCPVGYGCSGDNWVDLQLNYVIDKTSGVIIVQFEAMYEESWLPNYCRGGKINSFYNNGKLAHKEYQNTFNASAGDNGVIFIEPRIIFNRDEAASPDCTFLGVLDGRFYGNEATAGGTGRPIGVTTNAPQTPTGFDGSSPVNHPASPQTATLPFNEWCAWTFVLEPNVTESAFADWNLLPGSPMLVAGSYHKFSQYLWCERDSALRVIHYRVPTSRFKGPTNGPLLNYARFNVEWNTSDAGGSTMGGQKTRIRNLATLHNYTFSDPNNPESDTTIFQRPTR